MDNNQSLAVFGNRPLTTAQNKVERYSGHADVADIHKEAVKHIVAQQMQAAKTVSAVNLATQIYDQALKTADTFARQAFARAEAGERSDESHAYYHSLSNGLLTRYQAHLNGIVEVGVTGIAQEIYKEVIVQKPQKRGWFK